MIYRLDRKENRLDELQETTFADERILEPTHIEEWIRKNPELVCDKDEPIKVISKQQISKTGKRSDLVGIDAHGRIVIIELKRDIAQPMDEFQAIRYASYYVQLTYHEICQIYAEYLERNRAEFGIDDEDNFPAKAAEEIKNFCREINIPDDFNESQRIILVSKDFSPDLRSAVYWLIGQGIAIKCVALTPYKYNEDLFIVPQTILPTPEMSENIVQLRQAEDQVKRAAQREPYRPGRIEDHYNRLMPPLGKRLEGLVSELGVQPSGESGSGFHLVSGDRKIMVSTWNKNKIEFRFPKTKKGELEAILQELGITSLTVKEKSDAESYGLANPTPAVDYKEGAADFEDIVTLAKSWLGIK